MIMKNYFMKSSMMLMAFAAVLAGCSQEDIQQNASEQLSGKGLKLLVSTQDFVSDSQGRAITNDDDKRTSTFEDGDQMGLYIFSEEGDVLCDNLLYTYSEGKWTTDKTIYQYKNAKYVAYFPYCKDLSSVTEATDITTYFETNILPSISQTDAETYAQADLMVATTNEVTDEDVKLTLKHQFSMIELNVPCRKYITQAGGFEYAAPVKMDVKINEKTDLYRVADGVYRMIVAPGTTPTIVGSVEYDENMPINFSSKSEGVTMNALAAGTFTQFNVTYTDPAVQGLPVDDATGRYIRPLQPGDYYYSDGTIYPYTEGTVDQPITEGCIGVIFEVGTGVPNTPWTHGSVLALHDSNGENGIDVWCKWGTAANTIATNIIADITTPESKTELINKKNGYAMSYSEELGSVEAISKAKAYTVEVPGDDVTSGWYLPAMGQLLEVVEKLGGVTVSNTDNMTDRGTYSAAIAKISEALVKVDGRATDGSGAYRWWSTTEKGTTHVYTLVVNEGAVGDRTKYNSTGNENYARPVLSF